MTQFNVAPFSPTCETCNQYCRDDAALRGTQVVSARDVFAGRAVFIACVEHNATLEGMVPK